MRFLFALAMVNLIAILILAFENITTTANPLLFLSRIDNMTLYTLISAFFGMTFGILLTKIFENKQRNDLDLSELSDE